MHDAYELLADWAEDDRLAIAYPAVVDGQPIVVCTALDLEPQSKAIAKFPDEDIRIMFLVYVMGELKRRAKQKAEREGVHVEL